MKSRRVVNLTFHKSSKKTFEEDSATHFIDSFCQALALQMAANGPLVVLNDAVRLVFKYSNLTPDPHETYKNSLENR